ncbi:chemotaxis response regulator protein-glutamate methylesterase [bacterium]|nr:chemotaxis response regulator protein-glutamate methylesterase [bacterium]MCI0601386.1 chemotaxis response regulator protein-glutamate methylesterase [bacterium]
MIRILVVDDSAFSRKVITKILENIPDVQIVDTATDGQDALKKVLRLRPDLITLDLEMPNMDGFTFLRWVMSTIPTPVIVVSAQEADESVFKAMDLGALDFVVKPTPHPSIELEDIKADLIEKVLAVPLFQERKTREKMEMEAQRMRETLLKGVPLQKPSAIVIASSTGGPSAIQSILRDLPATFDVPILVAQHMPRTFTALFAERLNKHTGLRVTEAVDAEMLESHHVYIAPGGSHMLVRKKGNGFRIEISPRLPGARYHPSADLLFESLANEAGAKTIGAVLTGMGDDGCQGLARIKAKGGITIAESERTAIIFGMPQEAIRAGIVDFVLPLREIPMAFKTLCKL